MSKTSKIGLTRSRKTRPRRQAARTDVDWRDAMHDHCRQLGLLVELLEACGQPLEAEVVEGIGRALHRDVAAMQALMHQLDIAAERATRPGRKEGR